MGGYKTLAAGDPLLAPDLMTYLMRQVVIQCTSSTRPTPTASDEGMTIYETDTNRMYTYDGAAWVPHGQYGDWLTWTPTFTGITATAVARYTQIGKLVIANCRWTATGGATLLPLTMTIPVAADMAISPANNTRIGTCQITDASASALTLGQVILQNTAYVIFGYQTLLVNGVYASVGTGQPFVWAAGDYVDAWFQYEAA